MRGGAESYLNATAHLQDLSFLLENLKLQTDPLELFTIIVQVTQVIEQMLTTVVRQYLKEDGVRTHSFSRLLKLYEGEGISTEDQNLIFDLEYIEFASRQIQNFPKLHYVKYSPAFKLLQTSVSLFINPGSGSIEILKNDVLDLVKTYICLFDRLHRPLGNSSQVPSRIIDGFFSSLSSVRGLDGGSSAGASGGAGFAMGGLDVHEDFFTELKEDLATRPLTSFLKNLFIQIGLLKNELNRSDPKLMNFRLARGTVLCYQFLENVCAYILNDSNIARYNHDFGAMPLPEMGLTEEDCAFLELGKQGRGEARYREFRKEGAPLTSADMGASRARGGGASGTVKASEESGVVRSKAGKMVEDKLIEIYRSTLQISKKMLAAFDAPRASGASGAGTL